MLGSRFRRVILNRPNLRIPFPSQFAERLRGTTVGRSCDLRGGVRGEEGVVLGDECFVGVDQPRVAAGVDAKLRRPERAVGQALGVGCL